MKAEDISNALNEINEEYIESANERRKPKAKKSPWIKWVSAAAAAIAVVVLIGTKVFVPNTPEGNDEPVGEVGGTEAEYGAYLPILEYIESNTTAYGFEGYMAYDISELSSGNPWNEEMVFEALPVYRNNSFNEIGIAYPGIGEEAMNKKLENIAEKPTLKCGESSKQPMLEIFLPEAEFPTILLQASKRILATVPLKFSQTAALLQPITVLKAKRFRKNTASPITTPPKAKLLKQSLIFTKITAI